MENVLDDIDDQRAVEILATVVRGRGLLAEDSGLTTPQIQETLVQAFGAPEPAAAPTSGALARQALRVLAQDPDTAQAITALAQGPAPQRFDFLETVGIVTLALAVLSTHVRYKSDNFLFEKKALDNTVLKEFVKLLQRFLSGK